MCAIYQPAEAHTVIHNNKKPLEGDSKTVVFKLVLKSAARAERNKSWEHKHPIHTYKAGIIQSQIINIIYQLYKKYIFLINNVLIILHLLSL